MNLPENILLSLIFAGQVMMIAIAFIKTANGTVDGSFNPVPNPAPGPTHDGQTHGLYNTSPLQHNLLLPIPTRRPLHLIQI